MDDAHDSATSSSRPLLVVSAVILAAYFISALFDLPQQGAEMIAKASHGGHEEGRPTESPDVAHPEVPEHTAAEVERHPDIWMIVPFALLLGAIAVLPLVPATEHWWESNLNRFIVALVLGALTLLYYLILHEHPIYGHWPAHHVAQPSEEGLNFLLSGTVLANAVLGEYIPFIMLLFSLYTISGGIRIEGDLRAHPLTNSVFIAAGGILASFIGTTGAAMVLIRPLLETNSERRHVKHTVIFFIFVVCNCGGCLLPIGDPPLFLGYLRGVDFLWTFTLWPAWLFVNVTIITVYYLWDHFFYYPHEAPIDIAIDEMRTRGLKFSGIWPNVLLLAGVVFSVALLDPSKTFPGTDWHPWMYLREIAQLAMVCLSLLFGNSEVRRANNFNYHAILEVAALFFGIFICMQPPLEILHIKGPSLGLNQPTQFFWITGSLSSVLDNAPTYVVFFETARSLTAPEGTTVVAGVMEPLLTAISLGAVFMGAMTYIGNGPNFMVRAIAERSGIKMPSFFGYMLYSCCILLPLFVVTTLIFL